MPSALKMKSFTCKNMWVTHTIYSMLLRYHHLSRVLIRVIINLEVNTQANEPRLTDASRSSGGGGEELYCCSSSTAWPQPRVDHPVVSHNDNKS
jgi:hypothetical protein